MGGNLSFLQSVTTPVQHALDSLGGKGAEANARRATVATEDAMARANLAVASFRDDYCGISLQVLDESFRSGKVCAWSVNQLIDLMHWGLPTKEAREGVHEVVQADGPCARQAVLQRLAGAIDPNRPYPWPIKAPAYLYHPSMG
jgi:hypothetical protein